MGTPQSDPRLEAAGACASTSVLLQLGGVGWLGLLFLFCIIVSL